MNGFPYDGNRLITDKDYGLYVCNQFCSCHVSRCNNRLVGNGPTLKLEVFRCKDTRKGWGVRCREDIKKGTFVADYIGEVMYDYLAKIKM